MIGDWFVTVVLEHAEQFAEQTKPRLRGAGLYYKQNYDEVVLKAIKSDSFSS